MRLSEAIREGAKKHPQAFYGGFDDISTCALAAALVGVGAPDKLPTAMATRHWPDLANHSATCPACKRTDMAWAVITHLNDHHHWTREAIADWYEATFETTDESLIAATVEEAKRNAAEQELVSA